MVASTQTSVAGFQLPGMVLFARLRDALAVRRARNAARARLIAELNSYSDRELLDFGIGREDIPAVADGTFKDRR